MHDPARHGDAFSLFTTAAAGGNPIAEAYLGYFHYMGDGVSQDDHVAAEWYRRSALHGFADGQLRLGLMYFSGRSLAVAEQSLPRDDQEGEKWIRRAAEGGSPPALDMVARSLSSGVTHGVMTGKVPTQQDNDDFKKAMSLYRQAAAQNDRFAIESLCADRGFMVPVPKEIDKWCAIAHEDPSYGTLNATSAEKRLTPETLLGDVNFHTLPPIPK